jgi:putative transposase
MRTQGARSNDKNLVNEPADHALGRSRGGLSTKIHALTDSFCCPLTLLLSAGTGGDNPYLAPLLDAHRAHDTEAFRLLADKAYSHPSTRIDTVMPNSHNGFGTSAMRHPARSRRSPP